MPRRKSRIPGKKLIFRSTITTPQGKVLHAKWFRIRGFPIWIDENEE